MSWYIIKPTELDYAKHWYAYDNIFPPSSVTGTDYETMTPTLPPNGVTDPMSSRRQANASSSDCEVRADSGEVRWAGDTTFDLTLVLLSLHHHQPFWLSPLSLPGPAQHHKYASSSRLINYQSLASDLSLSGGENQWAVHFPAPCIPDLKHCRGVHYRQLFLNSSVERWAESWDRVCVMRLCVSGWHSLSDVWLPLLSKKGIKCVVWVSDLRCFVLIQRWRRPSPGLSRFLVDIKRYTVKLYCSKIQHLFWRFYDYYAVTKWPDKTIKTIMTSLSAI